MTANQLTLWYLVASVCFILALKGLSSPATARRGNYFGIAGMAIAVITTIAVVARGHIEFVFIAMLVGGSIGAFVARRVQMTQMPELVAAMHSLVGMAAVLIAVAAVQSFRGQIGAVLNVVRARCRHIVILRKVDRARQALARRKHHVVARARRSVFEMFAFVFHRIAVMGQSEERREACDRRCNQRSDRSP